MTVTVTHLQMLDPSALRPSPPWPCARCRTRE